MTSTDNAKPALKHICALTRQFGEAFEAAKREAAGVDFHDLEQLALRLLVGDSQPSAIALQWRAKLRLILVDEYQDINAAQEAILQALGRSGEDGNLFLVGDHKQSIYRFRLADPRIILNRQRQLGGGAGTQVVALSDNFRSHEGILHFVNAVCGALMRPELGGVDYNDDARLRFGNAVERAELRADADSPPPVELNLRLLGSKTESNGDEENSDGAAVSQTAKEARLVARRLIELHGQPLRFPGQPPRPASWSDMAILLRAPRQKAETYAREFSQMGVPLEAGGSGFFECPETRDLLSLLQILDNPLQDIPLLTVLRSPLVGLTAVELAEIRLAQRKGPFWPALARWHDLNPAPSRAGDFLQRFGAWRRAARGMGVCELLGQTLEETGYAETTPDAAPNLGRLLWLARQFDDLRGGGLYRFVQFMQAQQEQEAAMEPARQSGPEAVRLMSIHQSKGLEFPIVALADLGKNFNLEDLRQRVILDEELGLCPMVRPLERRQFYPSLANWLARRRQKREIYGEELRLLYVAMTRAANRLLLFGTAREKAVSAKWPEAASRGLGATEILEGRNWLDWIGSWLTLRCGPSALEDDGGDSLLTWKIYQDSSPCGAPESANAQLPAEVAEAVNTTAAAALLRQAQNLAAWQYPFAAVTRQTAKTSVSILRRLLAEETEEEMTPLFVLPPIERGRGGKLSATEAGTAHHAFLEAVSWDAVANSDKLREEAVRLQALGILTAAEAACLNLEGVAEFWKSDVGIQFLRIASNCAAISVYRPLFAAGTGPAGMWKRIYPGAGGH